MSTLELYLGAKTEAAKVYIRSASKNIRSATLSTTKDIRSATKDIRSASDSLFATHMPLFTVALMHVSSFAVLGLWTTFWPLVYVALVTRDSCRHTPHTA